MPDLLELRWMLIPFLACLVLSINHVYLGIHVIARNVADEVTLHTVLVSNAANQIGMFSGNNDAKADAHVIGEEHFFIRYPAKVLNKPENRVRLRQAVDHVADIRSGSAHVQEAGAGNVRQCVDIQIGFKH